MSRMTKGRRVPDLLVEKLHLGDLSPDEAAAVRARLSAEPDGYARLAALAADDASSPVHALTPPQTLAAKPFRPGWRLAIPALVAAFAAVLIVTRTPSDPSFLRPKGAALAASKPALLVYRQRPGAPPELLLNGALADPGDVIQLAYNAAGREVGAILSVDGRGHVTTHLPTTRFDPGQRFVEVRLPTAFALDDAPGYERFVLMTLAPGTGLPELVTITVNKP